MISTFIGLRTLKGSGWDETFFRMVWPHNRTGLINQPPRIRTIPGKFSHQLNWNLDLFLQRHNGCFHSHSPSLPFAGTGTSSSFAFVSTKPNGPLNHGESC